jgi:hydrogenase expression/formation protein HypD
VVYSPLDALQWARQHPDEQVVFFAVGFETTAPATALAIKQAAHLNVQNFHMLVAHVRVQPAMEAIAMTADNHVQGFLAAGHVCSVVGYDSYQPFVKQFGLPVVVTGFEPLDLLQGILACVRQLESGVARVENCYARGVSPSGNHQAQELIAEIYETCDRQWRGFGYVPAGGLRLQARWKSFDAEASFSFSDRQPTNAAQQCPNPCHSAEVLTGRLKPPDCPSFGTSCSPDFPLGAPMVSSEGACAAYYRYHRISTP